MSHLISRWIHVPSNHSRDRMKSPSRILVTFIMTLALCACGTPQPSQSPRDNSLQSARQLLNDANTALPNEATRMRIEAARQLLALGKPRQALDALLLTHRMHVPDTLLARYSSTLAATHLALGDTESARSILLDDARLNDSFLILPDDEQLALGALRGQLLGQLGEPLASAREYIYIATLSTDAGQKSRFHDAIWQALMSTPLTDLQQIALNNNAADTDFNGWVALAIIGKQNQGDLDAQVGALTRWQQANPQHPAAKQAPGGLAILKTLSANRPKHVAVLLPFAGRYAAPGEAVRDGLMAAWYQSQMMGSQTPTLRFYDTGNEQVAFEALYQQAIADGAEFVIGPLDKDKVRLLFDMGDLPVPTLALNEISDYGTAPANLYQFGLGTDAEIQQLAGRMTASSHTHVILVHSQEPWALRAADSFRSQWQADEQHILATASWERSRDIPASLKNALGIQRSQDRQQTLENILGMPLKAEPRRRQDVDAILLIANPETGRLLMPMLQFLYAGNIPAYATSHVFSGTPNPAMDNDLNRIRFCDMGWLLQPGHPLRASLEPWVGPAQSPYLRLYAMGADAFLIHPRLPQLVQYPDSRFFGYTGQIHMNPARQMERQLDCAVFRQGTPRLLPTIVSQPVP